jgi:uncharacterized repeat protein (TIGR01451 family)
MYNPILDVTLQLQDIAPGALSSSPETFTPAGSHLFFAADDNYPGGNMELWALCYDFDLAITQAYAPNPVGPGQPLTLTLSLNNYGMGWSPTSVVTDIIPAELLNISITSTLNITDTGVNPHYVWDVPDLGGARGGVITITGTVNPDISSEYTITNVVTVTAGAGESNLVDNIHQSVLEINIPPSVDAGQDQTVKEGQLVTFAGAFTDPGLDDTHTIEWDLGNGDTLSGTLVPTYTYQLPDVYTVTLTVTDDDGGVGVDQLVITVEELDRIYLPLVMRD